MFPKKVYHCSCVAFEIKLCLVNGRYSLKDIVKQLNKVNGQKIYCSKCGDNLKDVIFSCTKHMSLVIFHENSINKDKNLFKRCVKKYLQEAYHCCYEYTSFDLPISIKKRKKTLCLRVKTITI